MGFIADTVTPKIKEWVTGDKPHTVPSFRFGASLDKWGPCAVA